MTATAAHPADRPRRGGDGAATGHRADLRVAPAPARRRRTGIVAVVVVALVIIALFGNGLLSGVLVANQSELDRINRQIEREEARHERARLEVAELASPDRVVSAAREAGMVTPEETHWLAPRRDATGLESVTAPSPGTGGATEEAAGRPDGSP